jgi:hypothetical protein
VRGRSPLPPEKQDEFAPARRIRRPLSNDRMRDTPEFTTHLTRACESEHIGLKARPNHLAQKVHLGSGKDIDGSQDPIPGQVRFAEETCRAPGLPALE